MRCTLVATFAADRPVISPIDAASTSSRYRRDAAIERLECLYECEEPFESDVTIGGPLPVAAVRHRGQFVEADERGALAPPAQDLRRDDVVRDTVDPGSERTASVETREAAPERDVDVLNKIAAFIRVGLVRPRQAFDCRAVTASGLLVERVLAGSGVHHSVKVVAGEETALQDALSLRFPYPVT
jgi:hypothetical protein